MKLLRRDHGGGSTVHTLHRASIEFVKTPSFGQVSASNSPHFNSPGSIYFKRQQSDIELFILFLPFIGLSSTLNCICSDQYRPDSHTGNKLSLSRSFIPANKEIALKHQERMRGWSTKLWMPLGPAGKMSLRIIVIDATSSYVRKMTWLETLFFIKVAVYFKFIYHKP